MNRYSIIIFFVFQVLGFHIMGQSAFKEISEQAVLALEELILSNDISENENFIKSYVNIVEGDKQAWHNQLEEIIDLMHQLDGSVSLDQEGEHLVLSMANRKRKRSIKISFDNNTGRINKLTLMEPSEEMSITSSNVGKIFDNLEAEGVSGLVYIKKNGQNLLKRAFGMADRQSGRRNMLNTIFGTGSRPIDYTVASILLLDQEDKLSIDDSITKFISDVPDDKVNMTIKHLMRGQSGLPDFFDNESDWDADLAWVNRDAAIKRMMNQTLLFEPGKGRSHSHGAFGLLAAIVEIVSGDSYYTFIREKFLDPADMTRTGEYGESRGLSAEDFAVGWGPQKLGIPNIPPNWGPTSWLIKGSGGMYSTLEDLIKFYRYIREGNVLDKSHKQHFLNPTANLDGSVRGFELFSLYESENSELFLFLNEFKDQAQIRKVMRALENMLVES